MGSLVGRVWFVMALGGDWCWRALPCVCSEARGSSLAGSELRAESSLLPWDVGERGTEAHSSQTRRRFTVLEAIELFCVTIEAVRGRMKRDTLAHQKGDDGTV
jgi:hypothetical protein